MKTTKQKRVKAWAVLSETGRSIEGIYRDYSDALYNAQDVCFMGSCVLPQTVIRCEVTYSLPKKGK